MRADSVRLELRKAGVSGVGTTIVCPSFIASGMFDGVKPPLFTRWLTVDGIADKIADAVRKDRIYVREPRLVKFVPLLKVFGARFTDWAGDWTGLNGAMEGSRGKRRPASKRPRRLHLLFMCILALSFTVERARAHDPLFMMGHEAPGKGAFDVHAGYHQEKQGDETAREIEAEVTVGLTRDLAVKFSFPYAFLSEETPSGHVSKDGFGDPKAKLKWRFWDKDLLGKKYAAAVAFQSSIPTGSEAGRKRPIFMTGLSHGREGLRWYYFVDARYRYAVPEPNDAKPGDQVWFDAAYGMRPWLRKMDQTDVVFFFEANYLHESRGVIAGGPRNPDSGGDFFFLSPEVLIAPTNRVMFKAGVQIPVAQSLNGTQAKKKVTLVTELEFRFGL